MIFAAEWGLNIMQLVNRQREVIALEIHSKYDSQGHNNRDLTRLLKLLHGIPVNTRYINPINGNTNNIIISNALNTSVIHV